MPAEQAGRLFVLAWLSGVAALLATLVFVVSTMDDRFEEPVETTAEGSMQTQALQRASSDKPGSGDWLLELGRALAGWRFGLSNALTPTSRRCKSLDSA